MSVVSFFVKKRIEDRSAIESVRKSYCEYCGGKATGEPHHIKPRSLGGNDIKENLIQLCTEHHDLAHRLKISHHELIPLVAKREGLKISQVYAAIGLLEPQEEIEEKLEEKIKSYLVGLEKVKFDVNAERPLDELVQMLVTLREAEEETRWTQGEIVKILVERGAQKGWIAAQINRSATYVNNLLITYETFPDESTRVPELRWTHYKIAATKGKSDPHAWIARAADGKMSTRQLEKAIAMEEGKDEEKDRIAEQEEKELCQAEKIFEKVAAVLERGGPAGEWLRKELKKLVS